MRKVEVVPHDSQWRQAFAAESPKIAAALGSNVTAIHHIGSTAIPGIYAKPIIDLLVEVQDLMQVDGRSASMASLGYEVMGEYGIPDRRFFRKDSPAGVRTHHVHTFEVDSAQVQRHLAFRDYMINHPEDAQAYSALKRRLASEYPADIAAYMDGKHGFVQVIDRKAAQWRSQSQ
jgi:GrpB-like predicted nucleotidyltransferase (UPF0157 family)